MALCKKCGGLIPMGETHCPFCGLDENGSEEERPVGARKVGPIHPGGWDGIAQPKPINPADEDYSTAAGLGLVVLESVKIAFWIMFAALLGITAWQLLGKSFLITSHHTPFKASLLQIMLGKVTLPAPDPVNDIVRYGSMIAFGAVALMFLLMMIGSLTFFFVRVSAWSSQWKRLSAAFGVLLGLRIAVMASVIALSGPALLIMSANIWSLIVLLAGFLLSRLMLRASSAE